MNERKTRAEILFHWLNRAFGSGQKCPPHSAEASEFYGPQMCYDWVPKMIEELDALAEKCDDQGIPTWLMDALAECTKNSLFGKFVEKSFDETSARENILPIARIITDALPDKDGAE